MIGDEFKPGMVFAFNIDLFDPKWNDGKTGCVFAETIVITDDRRAADAFVLDRLPAIAGVAFAAKSGTRLLMDRSCPKARRSSKKS